MRRGRDVKKHIIAGKKCCWEGTEVLKAEHNMGDKTYERKRDEKEVQSKNLTVDPLIASAHLCSLSICVASPLPELH